MIEGADRYAALKELARKDLPTLKHLLALKKHYQEDGQLSGKDVGLSLQSILTRLFRYDEGAALMFGRIDWQPDLVSWQGFFDELGDMKLGEFLGISSMDEVPKGSAQELSNTAGIADPELAAEIDGTDPDANLGGEIPGDEDGLGEVEPEGVEPPSARTPPPPPPPPHEAAVKRRGSGIVLVDHHNKVLLASHASGQFLYEQVARYCKRHRLICPDLDHAAKRIIS
jgi:hypothetical protein